MFRLHRERQNQDRGEGAASRTQSAFSSISTAFPKKNLPSLARLPFPIATVRSASFRALCSLTSSFSLQKKKKKPPLPPTPGAGEPPQERSNVSFCLLSRCLLFAPHSLINSMFEKTLGKKRNRLFAHSELDVRPLPPPKKKQIILSEAGAAAPAAASRAPPWALLSALASATPSSTTRTTTATTLSDGDENGEVKKERQESATSRR